MRSNKCILYFLQYQNISLSYIKLIVINFKFRFTCGSMSRTVLRALFVNWWINPAYWTVVELSIVVLIGMPIKIRRAFEMAFILAVARGFQTQEVETDLSNYTFKVDDDYSNNALMALDSFQWLLDFRLPKRNISYLDMTTQSQNMKKSTKIPTIFPSSCTCFSATLPRNEPAMYGGRFFWATLIKDSCFSKYCMRIGQLILTRGTGHKAKGISAISACCLSVIFGVLP